MVPILLYSAKNKQPISQYSKQIRTIIKLILGHNPN